MLLMYPNGFLVRSDTVEEGCIIIEEPPVVVVEELLEDQTNAILMAMGQNRGD